MPITDIGSYVTTGSEFNAHWTDVDADRVANSLAALTLPDGYALADLIADVAAVEAAIISIIDLDNVLANATSNRDSAKQNLRDQVMVFRDQVNFSLKGSGYVRALPDTPAPTASEQKTLRALDDVQSIWTRINADTGVPNFTPPLVLRGNIALAAFTTELAGLRANYQAVTNAENDLRIARGQRDVMLDPLRNRFVSYRQAVLVAYGEGHPFASSLPDVYPAPGSTPDAVVLSGVWDEGMSAALLSWTASGEQNLQVYQLRGCIGSVYDEETSELIANFPPGTLSTQTLFGLASSGDTVTFKVFVHLTTGNKAGSNPVTITRT